VNWRSARSALRTNQSQTPHNVARQVVAKKWAGLLQYRVNRSDRLQYWVDEGAGVVHVEFAGSHP
jgi:hypothetical protein